MDNENSELLDAATEAARNMKADDLLEAISKMAKPEFTQAVNQLVERYKSSSKAIRDGILAEGSVFRPNILGAESYLSEIYAKVDRELGAVTRDARRYRWLRSRDVATIYSGGIFVGQAPDNLVLADIQLDAAIEAAMAAEDGSDEGGVS